MIEYLQNLLKNSDGFLAHVCLKDGVNLARTAVIKVDQVGMAVEDSEGEIRLIPWSSINSVVFEDC